MLKSETRSSIQREILSQGSGKNYTLLTKVSCHLEAGQESHKKTCFGAEISKANPLQSLEIDFAGHVVEYSG